ncbi:MAG TPA: 3'(2'),5'-bisphosphate nucleotidase CysQ [Saprospiraceae bacterium]|nr:3'(2'),5'-bisphosphate nucleotidase CysQ [Saprospiraceae bacterium]HMP14670.1 3'(2'),5'-bisphosphate nucleotidase CysQ [Saprospiraceae bacterium]
MDKIKLAGEVAQIARRAGAAIMSVYGNVSEMPIELKEDQSPLTLADKAANDIITSGLVQLDIRFPIISEESRQIPFEERRNYDYYWLVDPLDGTKEFLKRNGEFTVNIALVHRNEPVIGIVYVPALNEIYWAVKGAGSWLETNRGKTRLQAATFQMTAPHLRVVCSRSHLSDATKDFIAQLQAPDLVAKGSALKFLIVAKGEAHIYPRLGFTSEWDTCPAQLVLEEAGGKVIDQQTGERLLYNKESLTNPFFIAYGCVNEL